MKKLKDYLNSISLIYFIGAYLALLIILLYFKIKPYGFNLSSLIGIWKGFAELNPKLIDNSFIIYNDGGYDGQFFYMISKSLFLNGLNVFPILDSFFLRFNRIGLPVLSGYFANILGFTHYPIITLIILTVFHIYSYILLNSLLQVKNKYLALYFLFSPFSLNSILLLVSDSLFVSFAIICIYLLAKIGNTIFTVNSIVNYKYSKNYFYIYLSILLILIFTLFIKETGLVLLGTFFIVFIFKKEYNASILIFIALGVYFITLQFFKHIPNIYAGTNPLGFLDLIDYPLLGFYKSIQFNSMTDLKSIFREIAKFPIFILYILLFLNLKNIKNLYDIILFLPIFFTLFTAGVGEVGYWLSFDNISRMFTFSLLWIILLKNENTEHNDYYALPATLFILISLSIRLVYVKSPMSFYIY